MEEAFVALLLSYQPLTALVGDKINWNILAQGKAKPNVVLQVVDKVPGYTINGPEKLATSRIQVDTWAETYASALAISRAIKALLSGYRGQQGTISFQGIFVLDEEHSAGGDGRDVLHRIRLDFEVSHSA